MRCGSAPVATAFIMGLALFVSGCTPGAVRALRDVEPTYSLWHGPWKSTEYSLVHGTLAARIPDDIAAGKEAVVPVAMSCSPFSIWRPGKTYVGRCRGILSSRGLGAARITPAGEVSPEDVKFLRLTEFTGAYDLVDRIWIEFDQGMTRATGFWVSSDGDRGTFRLEKEEAGKSAVHDPGSGSDEENGASND